MALVKVRTPLDWRLPCKKKKKTSSGQGIWTGRSPVSGLWTSWWGGAPQHSSVAMPSIAGTCHWVSTAPDGIDTTDEVFSRAPGVSLNIAALCLPHWIEQCRWDSMHLAWTPTRPNALPAGRSRTAETYLFANSNQCEPVQHAQQTKLVFRSHSLLLSPRLPAFLPFRFAELVSPLTLIELCFAQSAHALCSLAVPSPSWGGRGVRNQRKKK